MIRPKQTATTIQSEVRSHENDQSEMTKFSPRGDGFGSRGGSIDEFRSRDLCETFVWPVLISLWSLLYHRFKPRWMPPRLRRARSKAKLRQPRRVRLSSGTDLVQVHRDFCFLTKHPINECGTRCSVFLVQIGHNSHLHKIISRNLK